MRGTIVLTVIEQLVRTVTRAATPGSRPKAPRMPRSLRPHAARSTFLPLTDADVIRRLTT